MQPSPNPKAAFVVKHHEALCEVAERIKAARPDLIVALARKGPRLGELAAEFGIPIFPGGVPVVCERALPFLDAGSLRRVVVFDDAVIWGGTLRDTIANHVLEGADVTPIVLAASRSRDPSLVPGLQHVLDLSEQEATAFSTELVEAFHLLAKPYSVDHPILEVPLSHISALSEDDICEAARNDLAAQVFRLTQPFERRDGLCNVVLNRPELPGWHLVCGPTSEPLHLFKIRFFGNRGRDVLRVTPMLIFRARRDDLASGKFVAAKAFPSLASIFADARQLIAQSSGFDDEGLCALYRLQMYLAELSLGLLFVLWLCDRRSVEIPAEIQSCLPAWDAELVLGEKLATRIRAERSLLGEAIAVSRRPHQPQLSSESSHTERHKDRDTVSELERDFPRIGERLRAGMSRALSLEANVSALLNALRECDTGTRHLGSYIPNRLHFGLAFGEIKDILTRFGISFEDHHLSGVIDYLVDFGVGVPLVQSRPDGVIDRISRFGEAGHAISKLRYAVYTAVNELLSRQRDLSSSHVDALQLTVVDKALGFMALVGQASGQLPVNELAVKLAYHRYGIDLQVEDVLSEGRLLQWAISEQIVSMDGPRIRPSPTFELRFPPDESPLNPAMVALIAGSMHWFADASIETRDSSNRYRTALSVTTCNTAKSTIAAIKATLRLWFGDVSRQNAQGCLDALYEVTRLLSENADTGRLRSASADLDQRCRRGPADLMSQSRLKLEVFRDLDQTRSRLRDIYAQGRKPGLDTFYRVYVEPLLDPATTAGQETELEVLERLGKLCQSWTTVLRECSDRVDAVLADRGASGAKLRGAIADTNRAADELGGKSRVFRTVTRIPPVDLEIQDRTQLRSTLEPVQSALAQLLQELESLVRTTVFADIEATVEPLPEDSYVVTYDLIASTATGDTYEVAQQRSHLNSHIVPFVRDHLREVDCVPTGNDENTFVVGTALNAMRLVDQLCSSLEAMGGCARVGVTSTATRQRLFQDRVYKTLSGQAFVVAARIRDLYRDEQWLRDGRSHVFLDEIMLRDLRGALECQGYLASLQIRDDEPRQLRGEGLPEVRVWEYVRQA